MADVFARLGAAELIDRLTAAQTAYGNLNSVHDLIEHARLRTRPMPVKGRTVEMPAVPWKMPWDGDAYAPAPALNEHGAAIRAEFAPCAAPVMAPAPR